MGLKGFEMRIDVQKHPEGRGRHQIVTSVPRLWNQGHPRELGTCVVCVHKGSFSKWDPRKI